MINSYSFSDSNWKPFHTFSECDWKNDIYIKILLVKFRVLLFAFIFGIYWEVDGFVV